MGHPGMCQEGALGEVSCPARGRGSARLPRQPCWEDELTILALGRVAGLALPGHWRNGGIACACRIRHKQMVNLCLFSEM